MSQSGNEKVWNLFTLRNGGGKWSAGAVSVAEPQPPLSVGDGRNGFSSVSLYIVPSGGSHSFVQVKKQKKKVNAREKLTPCLPKDSTSSFTCCIVVKLETVRTLWVKRKRFVPMDGKITLATVMDGNL